MAYEPIPQLVQRGFDLDVDEQSYVDADEELAVQNPDGSGPPVTINDPCHVVLLNYSAFAYFKFPSVKAFLDAFAVES